MSEQSNWLTPEDILAIKISEEGRKNDAAKPPVVRGFLHAFPRAIEAVSALAAVGANKYSWDNWKFVPDGYDRYTEAMGRHLLKEHQGYDEGPGGTDMLHIIQTTWNAMARLELYLEENADQPIKKPPKE